MVKAERLLAMLKDSSTDPILFKVWTEMLVGLDVMGDELGAPYQPLLHPAFLNLAQYYRENNRPRFGFRLHAGESVLPPVRWATGDEPRTALQRCFELHPNEPSRIRIGHGIAFLFGEEEAELRADTTGAAQVDDPDLLTALRAFRAFCRRRRIVFELNPTSNDVLLLDTLHGDEPRNSRTLPQFLRQRLPVTLCTDDDGVWAIRKCNPHHSHISVAHEYCAAIEHGEIDSVEVLEEMLRVGRKAAFVDLEPVAEPQQWPVITASRSTHSASSDASSSMTTTTISQQRRSSTGHRKRQRQA